MAQVMEVKIADTDLFKELINLWAHDFVCDERIPQGVRKEYADKMLKITEVYNEK